MRAASSSICSYAHSERRRVRGEAYSWFPYRFREPTPGDPGTGGGGDSGTGTAVLPGEAAPGSIRELGPSGPMSLTNVAEGTKNSVPVTAVLTSSKRS